MWSREQGGQRAFFPNLSKTSFDLPSDVNTLIAMGTDSSGGYVASQACSSASTPVLSASTRAMSCPGRPVFSKKASGSGGTVVNVKVVQATFKRTLLEKTPEFVRTEQLYIPVKESNANVPHITNIVQENWGYNYVLVTEDGLRLQDSPGTQG